MNKKQVALVTCFYLALLSFAFSSFEKKSICHSGIKLR